MVDLINSNGTLWHRWNSNAEKYPDKDAIISWSDKDPYRWTFSELILAVEKYAVWLKNKGVKPGEACVLILKNSKDFYPVYLAVVSIGAVPGIISYPGKRIHPEKFIDGLHKMAKSSGIDWILTEKDLESTLHPLVYIRDSTIKGMSFPFELQGNLQISGKDIQDLQKLRGSLKPDTFVLLQYSSGESGLQRAIVHSNKAVLSQVSNYSDMLKITSRDKIINWLPLTHFAGLFTGLLLPLTVGTPVIHIDPFQWAVSPRVLLNAITKERATLCWMPNSAFTTMASRIKEEELAGVSLESMRMFINCSEPVKNDSIERFFIRFAQKGLRENVVSTCYVSAETCFAVTQNPPANHVEKITLDQEEFEKGKIKTTSDKGKIFLSSGRIIKGCKIRIVSGNGIDLDEAEIGEIVVNSESMFEGYKNKPEWKSEVFRNNWFYSGDLGFMYKDNLYVIERKDDLIISAGNKIFPQDVEDAVSDVVGVTEGKVSAFGEFDEDFGSEHISVIVETAVKESKEQNKLIAQIIKAGMESDITIKKVYFVPAMWLSKSKKSNKKRILEK